MAQGALPHMLTAWVARASEFVEDVQFLNLPVRLAEKRMLFADRDGRDTEDGAVKIDLELSQEEWGDEGRIRMDPGSVPLLRPGAIERLAFATL